MLIFFSRNWRDQADVLLHCEEQVRELGLGNELLEDHSE